MATGIRVGGISVIPTPDFHRFRADDLGGPAMVDHGVVDEQIVACRHSAPISARMASAR